MTSQVQALNQKDAGSGDATTPVDVAADLKEQALHELNLQREKISSQAEALSKALRQTGLRLNHPHEEWAHKAVTWAEAGVHQVADYLAKNDCQSVLEDSKSLVRAHPKWAAAACLCAGFGIGQLLKRRGVN